MENFHPLVRNQVRSWKGPQFSHGCNATITLHLSVEHCSAQKKIGNDETKGHKKSIAIRELKNNKFDLKPD